ncbi:MAG: porin family protein [Puia sp.]|nr:porin family protein [Puia sp.]
MKKLVFVFIAAGFSFSTANAQGSIQFGVKGGLNLSNVSVSNGYHGYSYSSLADFNAGLFLKLPVARFFSIQPEVYYSAQGFRFDDGTGTGGTVSEHVNYLQIPVLAKFTSRSGFFAETGPQLGIKLNAKDKENGVSDDVSGAYNSADFSWVFGVGYKVPAAPVALDLRYNAGITNIANDPNYGSGYGQYGVRNGVFQLDLMFILFQQRVR